MDAKSFDRSKLLRRRKTLGLLRASRVVDARLNVDLGHEPCQTVKGRMNKQTLENVKFDTNQKVDCLDFNPISWSGGVVELQGSRAPEGAIARVAGLKTLQTKFSARRFDREQDRYAAVEAGTIRNGKISAMDADDGTTASRSDKASPTRAVRLGKPEPTPIKAEFTATMRTSWGSSTMAEPCTLAEGLKLLASRTSKLLGSVALAALLVLAAGPVAAQKSSIEFVSPEAALEQGVGAYRGGFYQIALPALRYAADKGLLLGQYHLALLYADNASATTDHVKAYELFQRIVELNVNKIDVDDDDLAPYVGRALTAVARYTLRGIPENGLQPDPARAAEFLQVAATFFRDPDAQFELAKMYLKGEGVVENHRKALGWLTALTQDGHVGAMAFFADLLWRGKVVKKDEVQALTLIKFAVANAPAHERIWIEDIYQSIYCGASSGVRSQSEGQVAPYRRNFTARPQPGDDDRLGQGPKRTCDNGEPLPLDPIREIRVPGTDPVGPGTRPENGSMPGPSAVPRGVLGVGGQPPVPDRR